MIDAVQDFKFKFSISFNFRIPHSDMAENLKVGDICQLLREKGFHDDVLEVFRENRIDGSVFVELTADDMKELGIKALGDRKKLNLLIEAAKSKKTTSIATVPNSRNDTFSPPVSRLSSPSLSDLSPLSSTSPTPQTPPRPSFRVTPPRRKILDDLNGAHHHKPKQTRKAGGNENQDTAQISAEANKNREVSKVLERKSDTVAPRDIPTVPDHLEGWEDDFVVPTQFSAATMHSLSMCQIGSSARREITQQVAAKMLSYCKYPSHRQFEVVASKIVKELLKGKGDPLGVGHGSWDKGLKNRFKNMRRTPRAENTGLEFAPPPKKKMSLTIHECAGITQPAALDDHTYDRHLQALRRASSKSTRNKESIMSLLKETAPNRRRWIIEERPQVSAVTEKFPALKSYDMLMAEFQDISNLQAPPHELFATNWDKWSGKILRYARLEGQTRQNLRPYIHPLQQNQESQDSTGGMLLQLLPLLLDKRKKDSTDYLLCIVEDGDELEETIMSKGIPSPYILQTGREVKQYFVAVEQEVYCGVNTIAKAVSTLFAIYFVFDIAYAKQCTNTCLFLERFLFQIKGSQKLNPTTIGIVASIDHMTL